jgi:hypothetical protein
MEKIYKIKVTSVEYEVTAQDVYYIDNDDDAEKEIARIKASLPQTMEFEIECEKEDIDDVIGDTIAEKTGWLNISASYEIIGGEENAQ